jgi:hypothetical protein
MILFSMAVMEDAIEPQPPTEGSMKNHPVMGVDDVMIMKRLVFG